MSGSHKTINVLGSLAYMKQSRPEILKYQISSLQQLQFQQAHQRER